MKLSSDRTICIPWRATQSKSPVASLPILTRFGNAASASLPYSLSPPVGGCNALNSTKIGHHNVKLNVDEELSSGALLRAVQIDHPSTLRIHTYLRSDLATGRLGKCDIHGVTILFPGCPYRLYPFSNPDPVVSTITSTQSTDRLQHGSTSLASHGL